MRRRLAICLLISLAGAGVAMAQTLSEDAAALLLAKRQADEATLRARQLERQAADATNEAVRARAAAGMLAARIENSEADITAGETRVRIIEAQRIRQRARLAERQGPVIRLTAALQTMARRPTGLALVQPGSVDDVVHVRALLASTLPVIRARTAALSADVRRGAELRVQADRAVAALVAGREELRRRRLALARFEADQRRRSQSLAEGATAQSDRALAFGEEARSLADEVAGQRYQAQVRRRLAALPPPLLRPRIAGAPSAPPFSRSPAYRLPVEGKLLTGMGELSEGGVHARGLTFETAANAQVFAPAAGRIAYAGRFRGYGQIVVIDHGGGYMSTITDLGTLTVGVGARVGAGAVVGRTGAGRPNVSVELRLNNVAVPIVPLIAES